MDIAAGPARRAVGVRRNPPRLTSSACGASAFFAARRTSWLRPRQSVRSFRRAGSRVDCPVVGPLYRVESTTGAVAVGGRGVAVPGGFRRVPVPHSPPWLRFQSPLIGRVESWRAAGRGRWMLRRFRSGPQSGARGHVSSSRLVKPSVPISGTGLSVAFIARVMRPFRSGVLSAGRRPGTVRTAEPRIQHRLLHLCQPNPAARAGASSVASPSSRPSPSRNRSSGSTVLCGSSCPTAQDGVDEPNDPLNRLRAVPAKHLLEPTRRLVRALVLGTHATPHLPRRVLVRRMSNPRKVKLPPSARFTRRVLSRLSSTSSWPILPALPPRT